jgi:3-deoxy-D-manno-octulosonate 8-phosphate phosphatase (KDO 8-P phosphatase)
MRPAAIQAIFEQTGGRFVAPSAVLAEKLAKVKCLVFDWDGVFHPGTKQPGGASTFSEVDSMGINLLRFALFLKNGTAPKTLIITGEDNPTARYYAEREHFDAVYFKARRKDIAFDHWLADQAIAPEETLFVFDDVLDVGLARKVGVRMGIPHRSAPLFARFLVHEGCVDYLSGSPSGQALREISELCIALIGDFNATLEHRIAFSETYARYWEERNAGGTTVHISRDEGLTFERLTD